MLIWKTRALAIIALLQRYPGVVAAFGFVSGVLSFILVDRQARLATPIAVMLLVSWLWLVLEGLFTRVFLRMFGREIPQPVTRYVTQMIHQESLFFVLPFFFITTTWNSGQLLFTGLLACAGLVTIIDPIYNKWLAPRRWLYLALHTLTLFAAMLTALPIILHLTTAQSYKLALGTAVVLSFPSLLVTFPVQRWWRGLALIALTLALGGIGWLARSWVPPATLWLTEVAVTTELDDLKRAPGQSLTQVTATEMRNKGLYAYTAINAPRGLAERIYHVWRHDGEEVDRIALDINGGREAGYRSWTHKKNFPENLVGDWEVRVLTEDGQVIGVLRFEVTDGPAGKPVMESTNRALLPGATPDVVPPAPSDPVVAPQPEPAPEPQPAAPPPAEPAPAP